MAIITTFENQCRALASAPSLDENASRFLVGTQSLRGENLLYLFEYKDDNNSLAKVSFRFPFGELWHLASTNKQGNLVTGVVGSKEGQLEAALFRLPQELENPIEDDYGLSESIVEKVFALRSTGDKQGQLTRQCHWHPETGEQLLVCHNGCLEFHDIESQQMALSFSLEGEKISQSVGGGNTRKLVAQVSDLRWSSLFSCSVVATAIGSKIYGIDTRISDSSPSAVCWLIEDERCNRVRSVDFNPNSQYYLASGGDDCRANFWDLRRTSCPVLHLQPHTHWLWSIRYNPFHDQLVLSAGGDSRVALMRAQSIASEPFGQLTDLDNEHEDDNENEEADKKGEVALEESNNVEEPIDRQQERVSTRDEVIEVYEEHDDSVYAAEWATDPWVFASLGFESRLVINKVPKKEKFNILF